MIVLLCFGFICWDTVSSLHRWRSVYVSIQPIKLLTLKPYLHKAAMTNNQTAASDSKQQPRLAFLLKSPSFLTYKYGHISHPAP